MTDHILIQLALRRSHAETPPLPVGASYDAVVGCWYSGADRALLGPMSTKKNDIETGEDMKGE
jgi:hypothetical protein